MDLISGTSIVAVTGLYVFTVLIGSLNIDQNFYMPSLNNFNENRNSIALTFDDGPTPSHTQQILDCLKSHDVKASFFIIGKNVKNNEEVLSNILKNGHSLGSHSNDHDIKLTFKGVKSIEKDFNLANDAIETVTKKAVKFYRPPYGVTNPHIAKIVKSLGMTSVGWNVRSFDTHFKNAKAVSKRILEKIKPGSILLFHDNQDVTLEVLNIIIPELKQRNLGFLTIDEIANE